MLDGWEHLPVDVWSAASDEMVLRLVGDWIEAVTGGRDVGDESTAMSVLGAVLAARDCGESGARFPRQYVAKCLRQGVNERHLARAKRLLRERRRQLEGSL